MNKIAFHPFVLALHHLNVHKYSLGNLLGDQSLYDFYTNFDTLLDQTLLTQNKKQQIKTELNPQSESMQYWSQVQEWLKIPNNHIVFYDDDLFPQWLKNIEDCPLMLYIKGENLTLLSSLQVAIVGSRRKSDYGAKVTAKFTSEIVINNLTITSGLAYGIDSIAHRNALIHNGKTIAVLGSGLENIYPKENIPLAQEIIQKQGLLVSEFGLHALPLKLHFPRRNRIISGLSKIVLITEGTQTSGSLITAKHALEQNRIVLAVPGSIFSNQSQGCHNLINQGAKLAQDIHHILEELTHYDLQLLNQQQKIRLSQKKEKESTPQIQLFPDQELDQKLEQENDIQENQPSIPTEEYNDINQLESKVLKQIDFEKTHLNIIAQNLSMDLNDLSEILILLEFKGYIENHQGSFKRIK